ncbi:MAG: type II toxin-antitoxin system RelE/ParE family toxin [Candidatus Methanospirareceae archaeon]
MSYRLKYTQTFEKQIEKIKKKDKALMEEAMKKVEELQQMPYTGKPLEYRLAPYRSVRVKGKYRLDVSTRGVIWKNRKQKTLCCFVG